MIGDFRVGQWLVQPSLNRISLADQKVRVEPKVLDVLVYLARHSHEVLSKEDILSAIWTDTHVTEDVLIHAISELRKAFQDDVRNPKVIRTIPKRGYQLIADIDWKLPSAEPKKGIEWLLKGRSVLWSVTAFVLGIVIGLGWLQLKDPSEVAIGSILVLPFENLSKDSELEYLRSGLAASISARLSRLQDLHVFSMKSSERDKHREVDDYMLAERFNVQFFLRGTVFRNLDSLQIGWELVNVENRELLDGKRYRGGLDEILTLEDEIAKGVVVSMRGQLTNEEHQLLSDIGTQNPRAYEAYLMGEYHRSRWYDGDIQEACERAISCWKQAVSEDPNYQDPLSALGSVYTFLATQSEDGSEYFELARNYWQRLIDVDPSTKLGHVTKARIFWSYERKWEEAAEEYGKAAELDPYFKIPLGYLEWMGRRKDCLRRFKESLDTPITMLAHQYSLAAWRLLWHGEYDKAIELAEKTLELENKASRVRFIIVQSHFQEGREQLAFDSLLEGLRVSGRDEKVLEQLKTVFEEEGMRGVKMLNIENQLRRPIDNAIALAQLGEVDLALEWLEKDWNRPLTGLEHSPSNRLLDPLRDHPRFEELLSKQRLPEEAMHRLLTLGSDDR